MSGTDGHILQNRLLREEARGRTVTAEAQESRAICCIAWYSGSFSAHSMFRTKPTSGKDSQDTKTPRFQQCHPGKKVGEHVCLWNCPRDPKPTPMAKPSNTILNKRPRLRLSKACTLLQTWENDETERFLGLAHDGFAVFWLNFTEQAPQRT